MKGCKKKEKRKRKKRNDNTRKRERERVSSREKFPHELLPPPARNDQLFLPSTRCTTPRGAKKGRSSPCLSSFEKENRNYDSVVTTRLRHWEESVTRLGAGRAGGGGGKGSWWLASNVSCIEASR